MSTLKIRVRQAPRQLATVQYITLDTIRIGLEFRWSMLEAVWYMWLRKPNSALQAGPIKLVAGSVDLLLQFHYLAYVPPGRLFCVTQPDNDTVDLSAHLQYTEA